MGRYLDRQRIYPHAMMRNEHIKLSVLFEEVISEFVTRNPGVQANFEIENRLSVQGDYRAWRTAIQSLVENTIRFCAHTDEPTIIAGRMKNERVCVVMDNGFQFNIGADNIILTVSLHRRLVTGVMNIRRIVVMRGAGKWELDDQNVGGIFHFSFN